MTHMKRSIGYLVESLQTRGVTTALDIGAGRGFYSLLMASYGVQVDALEPNLHKMWSYPPYLGDHPRITHFQQTIQEFDRSDKQYDLIVCYNVISFLDKSYVLDKLLPTAYHHLSDEWRILMQYFSVQDTDQHRSVYAEIDFASRDVRQHDSYIVQDNHPPQGEHTHHMEFVTLW